MVQNYLSLVVETLYEATNVFLNCFISTLYSFNHLIEVSHQNYTQTVRTLSASNHLYLIALLKESMRIKISWIGCFNINIMNFQIQLINFKMDLNTRRIKGGNAKSEDKALASSISKVKSSNQCKSQAMKPKATVDNVASYNTQMISKTSSSEKV